MTSKTISKKVGSRKSSKKYKNALVLSGGGMRGFAHIGVLEALLESKIKPDYIVGTSVGALVGVCYAAGKSIDEIKNFFLNLSTYKLLRPRFSGGLFDTGRIVNTILNFAGVTSFSQLSIPLVINATDINKGEEKVFKSGELKPALQASIAVPGVFAPVTIENIVYVDGGMTNPLPVHLVPSTKRIFVVDIAFKFEKVTARSNSLSILKNAVFSLQKQSLKNVTKDMVYIKPPLQEFDLYDYAVADRKKMLSRGKLAARKVLKEL